MRNKVIMLFCLLMIGLPVFAEPLKATVSYTEEDARIEAFKGVSVWCPFPDVQSFQRSLFVASINNDDVLGIQEFKAKFKNIIPFKWIGVIYKDSPNWIYIYEKTSKGYNGSVIEIVEKNNNYPIKSINYDAKTGKLLSVSLTISETETFVFDENKKPIGHWVNDKEVYNGQMTRKIIYSAQ